MNFSNCLYKLKQKILSSESGKIYLWSLNIVKVSNFPLYIHIYIEKYRRYLLMWIWNRSRVIIRIIAIIPGKACFSHPGSCHENRLPIELNAGSHFWWNSINFQVWLVWIAFFFINIFFFGIRANGEFSCKTNRRNWFLILGCNFLLYTQYFPKKRFHFGIEKNEKRFFFI